MNGQSILQKGGKLFFVQTVGFIDLISLLHFISSDVYFGRIMVTRTFLSVFYSHICRSLTLYNQTVIWFLWIYCPCVLFTCQVNNHVICNFYSAPIFLPLLLLSIYVTGLDIKLTRKIKQQNIPFAIKNFSCYRLWLIVSRHYTLAIYPIRPSKYN